MRVCLYGVVVFDVEGIARDEMTSSARQSRIITTKLEESGQPVSLASLVI